VERLTDELEARATNLMRDIDALGGAAAAIEAGIPQRWIAESAYRTEQELASGARPKVGVNVYADAGSSAEAAPSTFEVDPLVGKRQAERTRSRVAARDPGPHASALSRLAGNARSGRNVMPALIDAARAGATVGEMADVFRDAFGEFTEPAPW
jgi:methylmalonyl-CoA mutase N-terminal domain/subunit